ncbi:MAG: hypothetical protein MZU84_06140 [Sphingobacterium sp.]|nr:hypothetical protein [Sphingobacterium sp.]
MIIRLFSPAFLDPWMDIYPLVPDPDLEHRSSTSSARSSSRPWASGCSGWGRG